MLAEPNLLTISGQPPASLLAANFRFPRFRGAVRESAKSPFNFASLVSS